MNAQFQEISNVFKASMSPDTNIRKQAEMRLKSMSQSSTYVKHLSNDAFVRAIDVFTFFQKSLSLSLS